MWLILIYRLLGYFFIISRSTCILEKHLSICMFVSRTSSLLVPPPRKLTLQRPEPLGQSILTAGAETIAFFFRDDLHAVRFTAGYGINLNGIDDVGEGDDEVGGVFLLTFSILSELGKGLSYFIVFVESQILRSEHNPQSFPLSDATLRLQAQQVPMPYHSLVVFLINMKATRFTGVLRRWWRLNRCRVWSIAAFWDASFVSLDKGPKG